MLSSLSLVVIHDCGVSGFKEFIETYSDYEKKVVVFVFAFHLICRRTRFEPSTTYHLYLQLDTLYQTFQPLHKISRYMQGLHSCRWYKIVITWFVHLYVQLSTKLVDYLHVQVDKPCYNYYLLQ